MQADDAIKLSNKAKELYDKILDLSLVDFLKRIDKDVSSNANRGFTSCMVDLSFLINNTSILFEALQPLNNPSERDAIMNKLKKRVKDKLPVGWSSDFLMTPGFRKLKKNLEQHYKESGFQVSNDYNNPHTKFLIKWQKQEP